uniref:Uncharacterized protein n=1 Tax=Setaria viridis TaxID=4556 RepID=A0A4U6T5H4_SETVI|nr:hypothetical protein SEVIR_9G466950v2 [Setaria viridis]
MTGALSTWLPSTLPDCRTAACPFMPPSSPPGGARHPIKRTARCNYPATQFQPLQRRQGINSESRCVHGPSPARKTLAPIGLDTSSIGSRHVPGLPLPGKHNPSRNIHCCPGRSSNSDSFPLGRSLPKSGFLYGNIQSTCLEDHLLHNPIPYTQLFCIYILVNSVRRLYLHVI